MAAAKAGIGLATLPAGLADLEPDLKRVTDLPDDFTLALWLLTHEDLRRTARIRAFMDFLTDSLKQEASLLEGRQSKAADAGTGSGLSSRKRRPTDMTGDTCSPAARYSPAIAIGRGSGGERRWQH